MSCTLDCLVVGGGPAGLTTALYLRRFHREVLLCDAGHSRASHIPLSHNYPGFPEGISGPQLLERLRTQLRQCGCEILNARVERLERAPTDDRWTVHGVDQTLHARTIVLATGVVDTMPSLPGALRLLEARRLRFCPICDGFEFTGSRIGVIGAGEHGLRESQFIRRFSEHVVHVDWDEPSAHRRDELARSGIECIDGRGCRLDELAGGELAVMTATGAQHRFDVIYIALGVAVQSRLGAEAGARTDAQGGLCIDAHAQTSVDGLYAAGDVVCGLDQLVVGMGHAALAATHIHNRLG